MKKHRQELIDRVEQVHEDEVPIIEFTGIDGNHGFLDWIEESVG